MLTLQFPMLLALLGTALMAVVIFAPSRAAATPVTTSFAPPATPAFEPWRPPEADPWGFESTAVRIATWPALVDPHASGCDAAARLGLVEALAAVRTPWAEAILQRALDDEPDSAVRDAVAEALR